MIDELGIGERVTLVGAVPHGRVIELMQTAAIFTLPAVIASDGDRDGIPNVILEAMAMSLPVVSTLHSGIPEAVIDGITGLLVEPKDVDALVGAITRLLDEPDQALRMGQEGRDLVAQRFDLTQNVARLLDLVGS
jgi:glycosyltransferase involved in cell wall biosynthesis